MTNNDNLLYGFDDIIVDQNTPIKKHIEDCLDSICSTKLMEIENELDSLEEEFVQAVFCGELRKYFE